jgi:hypothetical protein
MRDAHRYKENWFRSVSGTLTCLGASSATTCLRADSALQGELVSMGTKKGRCRSTAQ